MKRLTKKKIREILEPKEDISIPTKEDDYDKAREELRLWLFKYTGCDIQDGFPCGTCFINLLNGLGLVVTRPEYHEHNEPVDRANEVWRALLQIREA